MIGTDPAALAAYDLEEDQNPPSDRYSDNVPDKKKRLAACQSFREWHEEWGWGSVDDFDGDLGRVPIEVLDDVFSISEIVQIWAGQVVSSDISQHIERCHPLLEKLRHTLWHFGRQSDPTYNAIVAAWKGLQRMQWPGGEVRIGYVSAYREDGYAENVGDERIWVDNDLAAFIHVGGKHVLTVGFGVGHDGVFLSQVQLRAKKGNRWLFKLDKHYVDVAIDMLRQAFGLPVWLVEGTSAVTAVRRSYGTGKCGLTFEEELRIASLYDRPLEGSLRTKVERSHYWRKYVKLRSSVNPRTDPLQSRNTESSTPGSPASTATRPERTGGPRPRSARSSAACASPAS